MVFQISKKAMEVFIFPRCISEPQCDGLLAVSGNDTVGGPGGCGAA
jgi:hypothetical protein